MESLQQKEKLDSHLNLDRLADDLIKYDVSIRDLNIVPSKDELNPQELLAVQLSAFYLACVVLLAIIKSIHEALTKVTYPAYISNPFFWVYISGIIVAFSGIIWGVNRLYKKHILVKRRIAELKKQKEKELDIL